MCQKERHRLTHEYKAKLYCQFNLHAIFSSVTLYLRFNSHYQQTINYDLCLSKLLICCLFIVKKVVVKFKYWVKLRM